jgi:hypothetical protein
MLIIIIINNIIKKYNVGYLISSTVADSYKFNVHFLRV